MSTLTLTDLPAETLLVIFAYCDFQTLLKLAQVCRCFRAVSSQDSLWKPTFEICANANWPHQPESKMDMSLKEYCHLSINWVRGLYSEKTVIDFRNRFLPWLQLHGNRLFVSEGNEIKIYNLQKRKKPSAPACSINCGESDVERFVVRDNCQVLCSCTGKTVRLWWLTNNAFGNIVSFFGHNRRIFCVDVADHLVFSGSKDCTIKIWSLDSGGCVNTIPVGDPVRSVAVNPNKRVFAAGNSGFIAGRNPLQLYDCETGQGVCDLVCESSRRRGAGVMDIKYDSPNTLLSCGYDTAVRLWDIRNNSRQCVKSWEDPHDSAVYCIDSDKKWTILSGTNRHGVVRMWDKRVDQCVKYYFVGRNTRSPVYSLQFNHTKLYVALDKRVKVLNFESC